MTDAHIRAGALGVLSAVFACRAPPAELPPIMVVAATEPSAERASPASGQACVLADAGAAQATPVVCGVLELATNDTPVNRIEALHALTRMAAAHRRVFSCA
jgi:hypothetical protein